MQVGRINRASRLRWLALLAGTAIAVLIVSAYLALSYRPLWYQLPHVAPPQYQQIRDEVTGLISAVGTALHDERPVRLTLTDRQVNRWIAARRQIWPTLQGYLPPSLADPYVRFAGSRIVVAVRFESRWLRCLLSAEVRVRLDESAQVLRVSLEGLRVGAVPVPRSFVLKLLRQRLRTAGLPGPLATLVSQGDFVVPNRFVWPNGKFPFRLGMLAVNDGRLSLEIVPLPRAD